MPMPIIHPTFTAPEQITHDLQDHGYVVLSPNGVCALAHCTLGGLEAFKASWNDLPPDQFLLDGGHYRSRRHSCFVVDDGAVKQTPHRGHWQPVEYNALHGGMVRMFEPIAPATVAQTAWTQLLQAIGQVCSTIKGHQPWYVEAHQFRIDTTHGIGRPTPEGAHRDGVDFVAILLVAREHVKGGESRIFDASSSHGKRFTLTEPWSLVLLDDMRVIHESTPIQPTAPGGHRDTLVLTYRAGGFQERPSISI